jgi:cyclophilin family peptidyl-prolyl cis-trans isomerase
LTPLPPRGPVLQRVLAGMPIRTALAACALAARAASMTVTQNARHNVARTAGVCLAVGFFSAPVQTSILCIPHTMDVADLLPFRGASVRVTREGTGDVRAFDVIFDSRPCVRSTVQFFVRRVLSEDGNFFPRHKFAFTRILNAANDQVDHTGAQRTPPSSAINIVQAQDGDCGADLALLPLQDFAVTSIPHARGAVSLARELQLVDGADLVNGEFFICVRDAPCLDNGERTAMFDGRGFAAFGTVRPEHMPIVDAMHAVASWAAPTRPAYPWLIASVTLFE